MSAASLPLYIEQGATKIFTLTWGSGTSEADMKPYDLTGCTARMQIRKAVADTAFMLEVTGDNDADSEIVLDADGVIIVTISDEKTDMLVGTTGVYDLEVEWPDGRVSRVVQGQVTISPNVTRET